MALKNLTFLCWQCKRTYSKLCEPVIGKKLFVRCKYCGEEGVVDLRRFPTRSYSILKKFTEDEPAGDEELVLPEVLTTEKPPVST
jgi:DNA-directed RNA polymerase subunit RPC12/RpoP